MKRFAAVLALLGMLYGCASSRPDHFYILSAQPAGDAAARSKPTLQAALKVTLPSLVDRFEMVLNRSAEGVTVLEHERWAAPLTDLFTEALGQDLERRRADILVGVRYPGADTLKVRVDIVQVTLRQGGRASIDAHWHIMDADSQTEITGSEVFGAPLPEGGYESVAGALSECLAALADRLAGELPHPAQLPQPAQLAHPP